MRRVKKRERTENEARKEGLKVMKKGRKKRVRKEKIRGMKGERRKQGKQVKNIQRNDIKVEKKRKRNEKKA